MNSSKNLVAQVVTEFLEIAVHNVLQIRKLYPDGIYVKKQKYGTIVYQIMHPQLKEYISNCMQTVYNLVKNGNLTKLVICFLKPGQIVCEKIIFDILSFKQTYEKDQFLLEAERIFRAFFINLHTINKYVKPLTENSNFAIQVHTTESSGAECLENPEFQNFPWVQVNATFSELNRSEIIPLEGVNTDFVNIQIYVEHINK